jgi:hypothetical protein
MYNCEGFTSHEKNPKCGGYGLIWNLSNLYEYRDVEVLKVGLG